MLSLVKIKNIALIDELEIEFGEGLNLLTGETGSGKSIVVDSLGALTGDRVSNDLIKENEELAKIEGLFSLNDNRELRTLCDEAGIELEPGALDLIVRRELSLVGKNRIFVNNQLVTSSFLKKLGPFLVAIHGQGEQTDLFETASHLKMLDAFGGDVQLRAKTAKTHHDLSVARMELAMLEQNETEKLQLLDILRFQVNEIKNADLKPGEDIELEEEKRLLNNVEKISKLSTDAYGLLYENEKSTLETLDKAKQLVVELGTFESNFVGYIEPLNAAHAVIEDLAIAVRDFRNHVEFSPERLEQIETRLAEITRVVRKYGGTIEAAIAHLKESSERLENIETAEFRQQELRDKIQLLRANYIKAADEQSSERLKIAATFEKIVRENLKSVSLEKAQFEVRIASPTAAELADETYDKGFTNNGFDRVEFYFSANVGESPKPLAKVASGGEASRLMLVLKTSVSEKSVDKTAIFDEVDAGIGGRVAEAVGNKLRDLAKTQQVICVTHQPQVASKADKHFVIEKKMSKANTSIAVRELFETERIEELARMLAGEKITDAARDNAREMLAAHI